MAGDWMKIELELPDKPEVHAIAATLNLDCDSVVGKLIRIWQWFDKHTTDGNAYGVTFSLPDRISGVTGFGEAMFFVGWLEQKDKTLSMPKFDRHTSASAKTRATTAKRVEKHRNAPTVTLPLPEKRREEKSSKPLNPAQDKPAFDPAGIALPNCIPRNDWIEWIAYRRERRLSVKTRTLEAQIDNLVIWFDKGHYPPDVIKASIANGWQGLFEPKVQQQNYHDERKETYEALTGKGKRNDEPTERDITGEATRVA